MSGIIGSAGSRSGVIGTTELDYEIGEWTPTNTNSGSNTLDAREGFYTKIGRLVVCTFFVRVINTTGGANTPSAGDMGGLPFTSNNDIRWGYGYLFKRIWSCRHIYNG